MTAALPSAIAIDGPAASGKTTLGRLLAERLDYLLLDTGVMYRAVALAALQRGVPCADEAVVTALACRLDIAVTPAGAAADGRLYTVLLDGLDVTWALRSAEVDAHVSQVSAYAEVRAEMVRRQRAIAAQGRVILVGRDIGTVVLPDAPLKLYVTATAEERARRRYLEQHARGQEGDYAAILDGIVARDAYDSSRTHSPLMPAADALILDTTHRTPEELVAAVLALWDAEPPAEDEAW